MALRPADVAHSPVSVPLVPGSSTVQACEQYYAGSTKKYSSRDWETVFEVFFENGTTKDKTVLYDNPLRFLSPIFLLPAFLCCRCRALVMSG